MAGISILALTVVAFSGTLLVGTNGFFTSNTAFVNRCPRGSRYVISGQPHGGTQYGVCDDCGPATVTEVHLSPGGVGVLYKCDAPSGNYKCEQDVPVYTISSIVPRSEAQAEIQKTGMWNGALYKICYWGAGRPGFVYYFKECKAGYRQEVLQCDGDTGLFGLLQKPACRCAKR